MQLDFLVKKLCWLNRVGETTPFFQYGLPWFAKSWLWGLNISVDIKSTLYCKVSYSVARWIKVIQRISE